MCKALTKTVLVIFFLSAAPYGLFAQLDGNGNAPDFSLTDVEENNHHLYEYLDSGKVVFLDFFAVWCGICQSNTTVLESIYRKFGPEGNNTIEMLSLETDNSTTDLQVIDFVNYFEATNPHINETLQTGKAYNITGYPFYYVVAPDRSYKVFSGIEMNLEEKLQEAIETSPGLRDVENDLRIAGFSEPRGTYCSEDIVPVLKFHNYGTNAILEFELEVVLDGEPYYKYLVTDSIPPYEYLEDILPAIENISHGWHEIGFIISSVNASDDAEENNGPDKGFFLYLEESVELEIVVNTDTYPRETFWQILEDGKLASESLNFPKALTEYRDTICLDAGRCYSFRLIDRFGDGMSEGGVKIFYNGELLAGISAPEFNGEYQEVEFCVREGASGINQEISNKHIPEVFPNPSSGEIFFHAPQNISGPADLTVFSSTGKVLYHKKAYELNSKYPLDLSAFPDGIMFLRISIADNTYTKKILIQK